VDIWEEVREWGQPMDAWRCACPKGVDGGGRVRKRDEAMLHMQRG
jgi:hypothetical protein